MTIEKPAKLIIGMFLGFCLLSLLAFVASLMFFPITQSEITTDSGNKVVEESVAPDMGTISKDVDGIDLIYPSPIVNGGGDGSKLIKTSTIDLSVNDLDKSVDSIKLLVTEKKGFLQSLTDQGVNNDRRVYLSIRVPSASFSEVLTKVKALGVKVNSLTEGSDDISEVYADVQARLKTQKALEKQLLELLNKATKVDDILAIQNQLTNVRTQIEMYESQIKNFDSQVDFSTLYITMKTSSEALNVNGESWQPVGIFKEALTSLVAFGKGLISVAIWAVVYSPIILVPVGIVMLASRSKSKKKK
jgi:hypothetical protein